MNIRITVVATALVAISGCSDESSQARGLFISDCVKAGAPKAGCACTFEKMAERYSPEELKSLITSPQTPPDTFVRDMFQSARQCAKR